MGIGLWGPIAWVLFMNAPSASAQPCRIAPIVVAPDRRLEPDAAAVGIALRQFLQNDARCEPVDLFAIVAGNTRAQKAMEGAAHLAEAKSLLDRMSYEAALGEADEAVAAYEAADLTSAFPGLLDSIALRALALHFAEGEERMQQELVRLFTLRPDYQIDPMRASPVYVPVVERARALVAGIARVALEVRSTPAAEIFVDGAYRGIGNAVVPNLPAGEHYFTSRTFGHELAQERAAVALGVPVELSLKPASDVRGLLQAIEKLRLLSSSPVGGEAEALAKWAAASEALVIVLERRGGRTWANAALHSLDGAEPRAADGFLDKPEDVEPLAKRVLVAPERIIGQRTLALGGGGIAAIGTGVAFGLLTRRSYDEAKALRSTFDERRLTAAKSRGVRNMVLANVAYGMGAIALGTGLYLGLTSDRAGARRAVWLSAAPAQDGGALCLSGGF